jgi:LysM repeat protein
MGKLARSPRLFNGISWGVTALIVIALLGSTFWKLYPQRVFAESVPTLGAPEQTEVGSIEVLPTVAVSSVSGQAIVRHIALKTDIDKSVNYKVGEYSVKSGDALFSIAKQYDIKPETLLWANYDILQDNPDSLRVGQVFKIPPTDGVYYQFQDGDTLESVADKFGATVDDILNWPGNDLDLSNPVVKVGSYVMIPGGERESVQWIIPTVARGSSGTASVNGTACGSGPVGSGAFIWPTTEHWVSGNDYWSGHLGIDIAASLGSPVWAADAGVVTMAQGGWNYGYGNVVMIDHGNGYVTLYGHLSQINVVACEGVSAGTLIGLAGSTGNSTGAHLHFEVRLNGGFVNPHYVLPSP